jgi:hypothetical protein
MERDKVKMGGFKLMLRLVSAVGSWRASFDT